MSSISTTDSFTVMVAGNTPDDLESVIKYLKEYGYELVLAKNDYDVLKQAELILPDLILLDTLIPSACGFETCRRLKENKATKDIPVIFISSCAQKENKVEWFEAGGVDYITKPFQVEEVLARIKTHLKLYGIRKQLEAQNSQLKKEIIEREQVEVSLKHEQSLLNAIMENIPDHVYCKDLQGRFTCVNQASAEWLGVNDPTQVSGKTDFDFFTSEHAQKAFDDEQKIISTGQPLAGEEEKETWRDGRETWVLTTKMLLQNQEGQIIGTMGISRDITARKQAEEELRKYKERLEEEVEKRTAQIANLYAKEQASRRLAEQLQASAQVVNSSLDLNVVLPTILDQLREVVEYDGASVQLVEGDAMRVLAVRGYAESEIGRIRPFADYPYNHRLASNPEPVILEETSKEKLWTSNFEYSEVRCNIGVPLIVRDRIIGALTIDSHKPAQYTSEDAQAALAFARQAAIAIENAQLYTSAQQELEERTRAEEALSKSQQDYASLINSIDGIVWEANADTLEFTFVSPQAERILGYPIESWLTEQDFWCEHIHSEDREWTVNFCAEATREGRDHEFQYRMMTSYGSVVWLHDFVTITKDNNKPAKLRGIMVDITERKQMELKLYESERRYHSVVEALAEGVVQQDSSGIIVTHNTSAERILGLSHNQVMGHTSIDLDHRTIHEDGSPFPGETHPSMLTLQTGKPQHDVIMGIQKSKHDLTWISVNSVPLYRNDEPKPYAVVTSFFDVTERKLAGEALSASEKRYSAFIKNSSEAIWRYEFEKPCPIALDEDEHVEWTYRYAYLAECNDAMAKMYGYNSAEEIIGMRLSDLMPSSVTENAEYIKAFYRAGFRLSDAESKEFDKDGNTRFFLNNLVGIVKDGYLLRTWGTQRDITERKKAEEALRENEERYRNLFQYSPVSLWEEDASDVKKYIDALRANGVKDLRAYFMERPEEVARCMQLVKILRVNKATLKLVECNNEEELLAGLGPTFDEKALEMFREELLALAEGNTNFEIEGEGVTLKGNKNAINVTLSVSPGYEETWEKILVSVTDLTARKRAEEALRESEIQLRQSQKMEAIGRLAGGIAHDFNNMLLPIIGYSDMLLGQLHAEDPLRRQIGEIKKAGERAAALTKQILAFSRKTVLQPQVLDLNEIVFDIDKMLERLIGEDIELKTKLHPALWSVKVDPSQIEQVIVNMVVNARDAMPEGGNLIIETSNVFLDEEYAKNHVAVPPGNYVMLAVSDTGRGMDTETQSRIFEPFFTTKERGKGTGLGLSTVYGIIKQSGGNIWVYSEQGHGTTFKIYLPRVEETAQAIKPVAVYETVRGTETILVVEDEESVRTVLEAILKSSGYKILLSASGKEALEICAGYKEPIHLLITDVVLPQMGGREVAERVAAVLPEIKVLYISGYTENSVVHHGMVLDPDIPFLQKPFSANALLQKVQEVLNMNRSK